MTERDSVFEVKLSAKSASEPVRYRVDLTAPHVRIDEPRGEFRESTTLRFRVETSGLSGADVAGSIKILTTLGDVMVQAPIHIGVGGSYRGVLQYSANDISLGDTHIGLDIIERNGDLSVRVDSRSSLLFPSTAAGETTGRGHVTSDGLDFTVAQVIDRNFGGERNHLKRDVGRSIRFQLKPTSSGHLEGTFTEWIVGPFGEPMQTTGTAVLEYQPTGRDPEFTVGPEPLMPPSPLKTTSWSPADVFGWNTGNCTEVVCDGAAPCDVRARLDAIEGQYSTPLYDRYQTRNSSQPISDIADACRASLGARSKGEWDANPIAEQCGLPQALACALTLRTQVSASDNQNGQASVRLTNRLLAPPLLVAKNELVGALSDSFATGPEAQRTRLDRAMNSLHAYGTWVMQPSVLEYLRSISPQAAKGPAPADNTTQNDSYPAARALADLGYTMSVLDAERARTGAAAVKGGQTDLATEAQKRAVLTFIETMVLAEIMRAWRTVPPSVAARFAGILTPTDRAFSALSQGANAFGVPEHFVPFVYRPEDLSKGATNFEQMLALAGDSLAAERNLESQFALNKRTYEYNQKDLQQQLTNVRGQLDLRIRTICGTSFNLERPDWPRCGADLKGEVGLLGVGVSIAQAKLTAAQSRIKAMSDAIQIDVNTLAETQHLRKEEIAFIDDTGEKIAALTFEEGVLSAFEASMSMAASANATNFFGPAAMAPAILAMGIVRADMARDKQRLETAQAVKSAQTNASIEYAEGMARIKKQMIDMSQLSVEMVQEQLGVLEAGIRQSNAIDEGKELYEERRRVLAVIDKDPSNDPSYRLLTDQQGLQVLAARADAQKQLFLAGKSLEHEINMSLGALEGAVQNAHNATSLDALSLCLKGIYAGTRVAYGNPQPYATTVSVRKMLGITKARTDGVTGQTLSEGEQFRARLLKNDNLDGKGGVEVTFSTNLQPGNKLWASDVCADRVSSVQAQLVGDFLGDNQAQVNLSIDGGSVMRACDSDALTTWSVGSNAAGATSAFAVLSAGVNGFGDSPPNTTLFGQSVARATWRVVIPGGEDAPSNSDVTLTSIDDIVLKFEHRAVPRRDNPVPTDFSCLSQIGGGR